MALEKTSTILRMADEAGTAVIAYICIDYNMVYSAITVAEEMKKPVIIMLLPEHNQANNVMGIRGFATMVRELADTVEIPVGLHLDHCSDYEYIIKAIEAGFTSVMIDGSMYSLEKNIAITKKVVETAHILGATVEAELGHVGLACDNADTKEDLYTKPDVATKFCKETGIDYLTVAIGSAHGAYLKTPQLDIKRLETINQATDTPLVLHGGSGIPHDQLEIAFTKGINKFNVGTEYLEHYYNSMERYVEELKGDTNPLKILGYPKFAQERLKEYLREKMKISKF
ncbi:MAG: class II fructose-bisphosphate aldolase [Lachnospiraceae bacterium]